MFYIDTPTRKPRPLVAIALLVLASLHSVAGDKQATTFRVRAVGYRAIPHESTTSYTTPGYTNTSCYGSGNGTATDWGYMTSISTRTNVNCQTVTTPPREYSNTRRTLEVYNLVESNGMAYTIRCTANWIASACTWLKPGDSFPAEVKDRSMWVTFHKGGNMGKTMRAKYELMDIRPLPSQARVQNAVPPTPIPPPPPATPVTEPAHAVAAPAPRTASVVATQPAPAPSIDKTTAPQTEPEAKSELTVTSDPTGAAVEINGVSVGTTPVTVSLAKGTNCTLSVKKDGFLPWTTHYPATLSGKFKMNANLMREVFR